MTWSQVVDDVVKIGLGAFVGVFGSYVVSRATARGQLELARFQRETDLSKDRSGRQEELIGEIALKIEVFHRDFMRYVQLIDVVGDVTQLADALTRDRITENRKRRAEFGVDAVSDARLGAKEQNDALIHPRIYVRLLRDQPLLDAFQAFALSAEILWIESGKTVVGTLGLNDYERLVGGYIAARDALRVCLADVFPLRLG